MAERITVTVADPGSPLSFFDWFADMDGLVRFVYGNQGPLFTEDAQVYRLTGGAIAIIRERVYARGEFGRLATRIRGSWETPEPFCNHDPAAWTAAVDGRVVCECGHFLTATERRRRVEGLLERQA